MTRKDKIDPLGVSIIVCTYNGAERLRKTLSCIFNQQLVNEFNWELIIVDNNSTDNSFSVAQEIIQASENAYNCKLLIEIKQGKNFAALCGLNQAMFDWVLICDDDNHLSSDYLMQGMMILQRHPEIGALGGCGKPVFETNRPSWFMSYAHSYAVNPQASSEGKIEKTPASLYGAGTFFRKQALISFYTNGFNGIMSCRAGNLLSSGGDTEWCYLVQLAGYKIWYSSQLQFDHFMPANRLTWNYYLQLKRGISSGVGKLISYQPFFVKQKPGLIYFNLMYSFEFCSSLLMLLLFKLRIIILPSYYSVEEKELGNVILSAKCKSYLTNYLLSYRHFKDLQKFTRFINKK